MKRYIVTIRNKGFFGNTTVINVTDKNTESNFYAYEDGCFKLYGIKDGKSHNFVFPLDKIDFIDIEEV